jgi:hypothetical protein
MEGYENFPVMSQDSLGNKMAELLDQGPAGDSRRHAYFEDTAQSIGSSLSLSALPPAATFTSFSPQVLRQLWGRVDCEAC